MLELASKLCQNLAKDEKMLIFFPGVQEVNTAVTIFKEQYNRMAFPLHGQQTNADQDKALKEGQIFIATSIAETSLTFPRLKYVLDSRRARVTKFNVDT